MSKKRSARDLSDAEALKRLFPKPVRDEMRREAAKAAKHSRKDKRKPHDRKP